MSRVGKNIAYNLGGQTLLLLLGLIAVRFVYGKLGADALGILYGATSLALILSGVLELGISATTVREVSRHLRTDRPYVHDLVKTASLLYWCGYAVLSLLIYIVAPVIVDKWVHLHAISASEATASLRILGIGSWKKTPPP